MAWGNSFEEGSAKAIAIIETGQKILKELTDKLIIGIDLAKPGSDQTIWTETTFEDGKIKHRIVPTEEIYKNVPPTHDPYTNPNAHIYYECSCGAILDPQTKSFAALNNHASNKGWKIRFTDKGYVPYCVKCGEGVE